MARIAYVNGRYVPLAKARVAVEDRGFQFADGVYEVITIQHGHPVDEKGHLDRLARSLGELEIAWPLSRHVLVRLIGELARRNRIYDGIVYIQITRGVAPRDFKFPAATVKPTLVMTARPVNLVAAALVSKGVPVVTIPDIRWKRRDIKSVSLLPNVLGKQVAARAGAYEAWQVDEDGYVTEGCSSNAWIVTADGRLVTRPVSHDILRGVTRQSVLQLAMESQILVEERPFTVAEAYAAREAFLTAASNYVMPITRIDGRPVGDGRPGPFALKLRGLYVDYADGAGAGPEPAE